MSDVEYTWSRQRPTGVSAEDFGRVVSDLSAGHGVTSEAIVEAARPEDSPIHAVCTWDDAEAARLRRLDEAQAALRSIRIRVVGEQEEPRRAFISVRPAGEDRPRYMEREVVLTDEDLFLQAELAAIKAIDSASRIHRELLEDSQRLAPIYAAIDKAKAE